MSNTEVPTKVKAKVTMGAVVTRGPSGEHGIPGSTEDLGEQSLGVVEIDYEKAVALFGQEKADELFQKSGGTDE